MPRARSLSLEKKRAKKNENSRKSYYRKKYGTDPPAPGTVSTRRRQYADKPLMTWMPLRTQATVLEQTPGRSTGRRSPSRLPNHCSTRSPQYHTADFNIKSHVTHLSGMEQPPESGATAHTLSTPLLVQTTTRTQPPELNPLIGTVHQNIDPFYGVDFEQLRPFYDTNFSASSAFSNDHEHRAPNTEKDIVYTTSSADVQRQALHVVWDCDVDIDVAGNSVPPTQVPSERPRVATSPVSTADPNLGQSAELLSRDTDVAETATLPALWRVLEKMKKKNQELASRSSTLNV